MTLLPIGLEMAGIIIIGIGIGIEIKARAHIGFVLITIGSVIVAAGGIIWGKFM